MLRMMGYEVVSGSEPEEWDVLWTHEYSLMNDRYMGAIRKAKPHQIVNHVAGSGYYNSKVSLATSRASKDTLRAFQLPKQKELLLAFAKDNPHMLWVQKDNTHRFCAKDYNPFDVDDVDKYVVGDDYTPVWEIPSLKRHFVDQKLGWKGTLDAYLRLKGMDPQKIWKRIDRMIAEVFQSQQAKMLHALKSVPSKARFFELSRFDFMVDADLNVHLLEIPLRSEEYFAVLASLFNDNLFIVRQNANMSPNLSSGHFAQNQILYEEVLLNLFSLVGIASAFTQDAREEIR
ncbi:hypothetical protein ANCCEY_14159 [Ancylostoma ceylanicum]|uniref:Tubulin-tyrosine ligase family protein n=1 Tax=Ancylostoma ceylanicum TaxID=53326 RepID=A0A0D6LGG4_9BILA|nr:hypothetical protein ANCCEY_14159 [Ancylostoma ceylanicum]